GNGKLSVADGAYIKGVKAWGKAGVIVTQMRYLPATLYLGDKFDENAAAIIPFDENHVTALYCYCTSEEYRLNVRAIDQSVKVTNKNLLKVPFDLGHWQAVAAERYPNGLPKPHSYDPTQWLFKGDIATSTDPLQVAVARLLGYRWPD